MKWLIPVDGSELSIEAVVYAVAMARAGLHSELVLVNVQEPATVYEMVTLHDEEAIKEVTVGAGMDIMAPAVELARAAGLAFTQQVLIGDPVPMLLEALEAEGCDGVIMGSHGRGLVSRAMLGSVSQAMLERSPVPVTFVKGDADEDRIPLPEGETEMNTWEKLTSADGELVSAYVARPVGQPRGGLVLLQEIFGINSHIRSVAEGYAADGYLVVVPSTFERVRSGVELGYTESDMQQGFALKLAVDALPQPGVLADIQAAVNYAEQESGGKVGVVGYCWGGLLTWRSACELEGLAAAVCYYGGGMTTEAEAARQAKCPVLAHFAEDDQWIPMDSVRAFQARQPDVVVHTYAAHHGFNCDQRGSYHASSALIARERSLAFLGRYVG